MTAANEIVSEVGPVRKKIVLRPPLTVIIEKWSELSEGGSVRVYKKKGGGGEGGGRGE